MAKRRIKTNIWVDSIFATIFIYLFMYMVQNISTFRVFDALDPIGEALADMELTDYAFSELRDPLPPDTSIVLVNIGPLSRGGIAEQIRIIDRYNPKVIGIDGFFKGYKDDTLGSLSLGSAIADAKSDIVMVAKVDQSDSVAVKHQGEEIYDILYASDSLFIQNAELAIANLDTDARYQSDVKICRKFPPKRKLTNDEEYNAFGAQLAEKVKPGVTQNLFDRDNDFETINFRGDFVNIYGEDKFSSRFYALDFDQVLTEDFVPELLKDKIVLVGYLGDNFLHDSWEDKFFTPLNEKIAGRANPDMYGLVIHANITSMILNGDYVDTFSETTENILGVILCFLNVLLFSWIYRNLGTWYDGTTKLIQVVEVLLILLLIIYIFSWKSFKLELTIGLFAVALAGDLLEVYYGVIKNIFSKKNLSKVANLGRKKSRSKHKMTAKS
ncbi:CHASE2 domain-containing protein [Fulvivirga sp. RKSG066]|uniref:CHASE2 domain-containing protein n=1 Tax=Fulvivirga aurantia TaxID=2529383 RepID=UPI0012BCD573|nr:CHASE2 domain-containing protein [Fulvivirga aurantia]MTI22088.1 CHASE2 domain-containing protein [Fulvivirga aurantia]